MLEFLRKYSECCLIVSVKMRTDICDVICALYLFCIRHPLQFSFSCKDMYFRTKERTIGNTSLFYATFVPFLPSFFVDLDGSGQAFTHLEILWCRQLMLHFSVTRSFWNFSFRKSDAILKIAYQDARGKPPDTHVTKKNWNRHFKENFLKALTIYPIATFTDALLFHFQSWDELAGKIFSREWFWRIQ